MNIICNQHQIFPHNFDILMIKTEFTIHGLHSLFQNINAKRDIYEKNINISRKNIHIKIDIFEIYIFGKKTCPPHGKGGVEGGK